MSVAIKVKNLSKAYQLGSIGTGTLSKDIERWWAKVRGNQDPFLKVGEVNDRTIKGKSDIVWALKDINFEINKGDAVGIIGKNGAGKSTLLKLLSQITAPTTGNILARGRISSLLEVGTGFHPELTGRENIFLNGAILGMRKEEIKRKFDDIVDFSGVERYIDTPVKRYSSGMYVRLAFAVAANLEPDILIIDEVLAVGDAEFQKKCLGKMEDASKFEGRTVLFVSHNMTAVQSFCTKAILLQNGALKNTGNVNDIVNEYLSIYAKTNLGQTWQIENAPGNNEVKLLGAIIRAPKSGNFCVGEQVEMEFEFLNLGIGIIQQYDVTFYLFDEMNNFVFVGTTATENNINQKSGYYKAKVIIPENLLNEGTYTVKKLLFVRNKGSIACGYKDVLTFEVIQKIQAFGFIGNKEGIVKPLLNWQIEIQND